MLSVISLTSCNFERIKPSGIVIKETRDVTEFSKLSVSHGIDAEVRAGNSSGISLQVEADDNVLPYVETYIRQGTLVIGVKNGVRIRGNGTIRAYVESNDITSVSGSGGSRIDIDGTIYTREFDIALSGGSRLTGDIDAEEVDADLSGGSKATVSGVCGYLDMDVSGGSKFGDYSFAADEAEIDASGGSNVTLTVNNKLKVSASGGSKVRYKGNPQVSRDLSGGSEVIKE